MVLHEQTIRDRGTMVASGNTPSVRIPAATKAGVLQWQMAGNALQTHFMPKGTP